MRIAVPKEMIDAENRVALIPATVPLLLKAGLEVSIESGAGESSSYLDEEYQKAGATIEKDVTKLWKNADIILKVRAPSKLAKKKKGELDLLQPKQTLICLLDAFYQSEMLAKLATQEITSFAMEFIPRTTRAQSMDALSSMAAIAGYRAVLTAAVELTKYLPMLMTAAGTIKPSKVFILGAGVAGLMAIATAKRLGAVVEAYDVRAAAKEQVESLGAKFIQFDVETAEGTGGYAKEQSDAMIKKQQEQMTQKVAEADIVITTAAIPGKQAPILVTEEMVKQMKRGSVIVDLAAERGGNVVGTVQDEKVIKHGVTILGYADHHSRMSSHASQLYSKNISTFLLHLIADGQLKINQEDEIIAATLVTYNGSIVHSEILNRMQHPTHEGE